MKANQITFSSILLFLTFIPLDNFYSQEARGLTQANGIEFGSPLYGLHDIEHKQLFKDEIGVATIMAYWKPAYWGMVEAFAEQLGQGSSPGQYRIKNISNNNYLSQTADFIGANANLQALNPDWTSQQWTIEVGPDDAFRMKCDWRDWYLNAGDVLPSTSAHVYSLNPDWWSMMWFLEPAGNNSFRLKHRWSELYLTAANGNDVIINNLNATDNNQLWLLEPLDDCLPNFILNKTVSSGEQMNIQVTDWIKAMSQINTDATVNMHGTNEVELLAGFQANAGSLVNIDMDGCDPETNFQLANLNANGQTQSLYNFLNTYQDNPNQCLILGQNLGWSFEMYSATVDALNTQTGEFPGVIGGQMRYTDTEINYPALVNLYSGWQANGGIVELSMLPDNPWTGGNSWDRSVTDIWKLTTPGQDGYSAWRTQLDFYADKLSDMQNAGVVVIWRPLMEMNGDWFWYGYTGGTDAQPFIDLYRDMFDYFTNTKQLNNLIWVYSANMAYTGIPAVDHYYPGDDVVDMTGLDVYQNNIALPTTQYQTMINLGKPFALTEFGPDHNNMDGSHDYLSFVNKILTDYPETIYALAWHDWPEHLVAWISNQNYSAAMNLPCVVTRDEMGN